MTYSARSPSLAGALLLAVPLLTATEARAESPAAQCVAQSDEGQFLRDNGKMLGAREALAACAKARCPSLVRKACAEWLTDVEARLPTVVASTEDSRGSPIDAELLLDGAPWTKSRGEETPLDPGFHVFQATAPGKAPSEVKLQLREREKAVPVRLVLEDPAPVVRDQPEGAARRRNVPAATWILGAAALTGAGVSFGFWRSAVSEGDALLSSCAPGCNSEEVAPVERDLLVSRVALGVAIGAAAAAIVWLLVDGAREPRSAAR